MLKPNYFFKFIDFEQEALYNKGFFIPDLFPLNSLGLLTKRDNLSIGFNSQELTTKIKFFLDENKSIEEVCNHFKLVIKDKDKWDALQTKSNVLQSEVSSQIRDILYRPFDNRKVFYNPYFVARPNPKVLGHFINDNAGLIICRQGQAVGGGEWNVVFTCKYLTDQNIYRRGGGTIFPLYIYPENNGQQTIEETTERKPNLNQEIVTEIAKKIGLTFTNEKEVTENTFAPIDILDFIYANLHSRKYREKYKEFLKTDFPKVPYPKDKNTFWQLVKLGGEIREIHLLESNKVEDYITSYEMAEDAENDHNIITTKIGKKDWEIIDTEKQLGRIWINESKYFDNIPVTAWEFYIGGYQPAQKWLKDRKERELKFEDILHYQKIIVALTETDRIMKEIDKIEIE